MAEEKTASELVEKVKRDYQAVCDAYDAMIATLKARIRELEELWENAVTARDELHAIKEANTTALTGIVDAQRKEIVRLQESALAKANDIISGKNTVLREALGAADKEIETAQAILKKAMLSGDIPTTPNTYTLVNADMDLRAAHSLITAALKGA